MKLTAEDIRKAQEEFDWPELRAWEDAVLEPLVKLFERLEQRE